MSELIPKISRAESRYTMAWDWMVGLFERPYEDAQCATRQAEAFLEAVMYCKPSYYEDCLFLRGIVRELRADLKRHHGDSKPNTRIPPARKPKKVNSHVSHAN